MARREKEKEKEMKSITINGTKHYFLKLKWFDICGDSTTVGDTEFNRMECAEIISEGYLYDIFEKDGREYVRTFASRQEGMDFGYGDRNVFPIEVFDKPSQKAIREAHRAMLKG
jgi:hypothetical protein